MSNIILVYKLVYFTGYIGCFKENIRKRVYNVNPGAIKVGTLTQEKCVTICGFKYTYAALTRGTVKALETVMVKVVQVRASVCDQCRFRSDQLSLIWIYNVCNSTRCFQKKKQHLFGKKKTALSPRFQGLYEK